jgi:ketosteroid isomerase-like protein
VATESAIRQAMDQYVAALQARNLTMLKRVWPSLSAPQERALRNEFDNARSVQVQLADPRTTISGDSATVVATRQYMLNTADGQRLSTVTRTTITLRRSGNEWLIDQVVHQQR